ncbi:hypothetical protein BC835DRAFT_1360165 [Cytidiella melzeri]|nr:hypothetical protein BC835DRAFT_1360165 [Cytidiella melzeri]
MPIQIIGMSLWVWMRTECDTMVTEHNTAYYIRCCVDLPPKNPVQPTWRILRSSSKVL